MEFRIGSFIELVLWDLEEFSGIWAGFDSWLFEGLRDNSVITDVDFGLFGGFGEVGMLCVLEFFDFGRGDDMIAWLD